MGKPEEKRLCWSCDGYVSFEATRCPYCGSELATHAGPTAIPPPPFPAEFAVTSEEWANPIASVSKEEQDCVEASKNERAALLMLIPGITLTLFACMLLFFSKEGIMTLQWKQGFACFYLLGAAPLLLLGWRSLK